jgi:L-threonylcarbamoyladenylate synthase
VEKINILAGERQNMGEKVGIICTEETCGRYRADVIKSVGSRQDEDSIAHHLYGILREFDELDIDVIYSESFSTPRIGQAIMNRLLKAAGHQVIEV